VTTLTLTLLLAVVVGCLTAAATAVRSVSRLWLRDWAERQLAGAGGPAAPYLERPHRLLLAASTGIAATVFALGATVALREDRDHLVRHLLLAGLVLLVVGQLVPRAVGRRWAADLVPALLPMLRVLDALFGPILRFAASLVRPLAARLAPPDAPAPDPIEDLLREGELEGVGAPAEREIIAGVVEFGEKPVGVVMTPRTNIVAVPRDAPADDVARTVAASHFARLPVYLSDLDHVVGALHVLDVLAHPDAPFASLRPAAWARADEPCGAVMRRLLREGRQLAIVRGVEAETVGLLTLKDLVEELVGDIRGERHETAGPA